jgi:hypothetical protein
MCVLTYIPYAAVRGRQPWSTRGPCSPGDRNGRPTGVSDDSSRQLTGQPTSRRCARSRASCPARVPSSNVLPGRNHRRRLGSGGAATPGRESLALLPSGPDAVRMLPLPRNPICQHHVRRPSPVKNRPRTAFGPAGADFGFREPLPPHLARPGLERVATRARDSPERTPASRAGLRDARSAGDRGSTLASSEPPTPCGGASCRTPPCSSRSRRPRRRATTSRRSGP